MKKLITFIFVFVACFTTQAQNIPLINGDCSTDATLTGASPFIIPGFTVAQISPANLNLTTSGISGGKLKIFGTANGTANNQLTITTDKVDISSFAADATLTFGCNFTCGTATSSAQPYNVTIIAYAADGVTVISSGVTSTVLTLTKIQENSNVTPGTVINAGAVAVMNNAMGNCKYLSFQLQVGKMITNNLTFDDFTFYSGKVPSFNVTPSTNLALSTEAGVESAESSFTVDGSALTSNVLVFGGSSLEMSTTSGSGFSQDTLKLIPAGDGSLASTTIYARIKAGVASVPTVSSTMGNSTVKASIYHKGSGTKIVQFAGTLTGFASTLPAVDTLTTSPAIAYSKNLKISANSLTADLIVSAGSKLEIATDSLFASPQSSIILPSVGDTVYVRLKKGLPIGITTDETTKVSITSTGFISKYIQFKGNSVAETAVKNINSSNIKCFAVNGRLYIQGVEAGKHIAIFNNLGQIVKSATATDNTCISIPTKGIYFVKSDGFIQKVILK
jgi:hypothetical protein